MRVLSLIELSQLQPLVFIVVVKQPFSSNRLRVAGAAEVMFRL